MALIPSSSSSQAASNSSSGTEIGQLVNVSGDVEVRLPRQVRFKKAKDTSAFFAQEMLATHGAKSEASLVLDSGAVIHVLGNTRVVAEFDPNHEGALFVTVLNGELELKKEATKSKLHFVRDGREFELKVGQVASLVPVIGRSAKHEPNGAASVVATIADETRTSATTHAAAADSNASPAGAVSGASLNDSKSAAPTASTQEKGTRLTLNNDDISKQVKSQMSFFQRCYLNFLGRSTGKADAASNSPNGSASGSASGSGRPSTNGKTPPPGSGPNGGQVVVLGFTIQNTGRVNQTHVVRSDIQDVTLQKCLTEVLERTSFRSFAGDDIEVSEYPILLQ